MANVVRAALVQSEWTGDKESMIEKNIGYAREAAAQGGPDTLLPGDIQRPVFLHPSGERAFRHRRADPGRPHDHPHDGAGPGDGDGADSPHLRDGGRRPLLQRRRGDRQRRRLPGEIPQDPHPPRWRASGRSSTSGQATSGIRCSTPRWAGSGCTSATTATSRKDGVSWGWPAPRSSSTPSATTRGHSKYLWELEQPAAAVANEYFVGAINRVGSEDLEDTDYYGSSYFASPRGQIIDGIASDTSDEVVVRDLDLDLIEEVRHHWAFYRDRRPEVIQAHSQPLTRLKPTLRNPGPTRGNTTGLRGRARRRATYDLGLSVPATRPPPVRSAPAVKGTGTRPPGDTRDAGRSVRSGPTHPHPVTGPPTPQPIIHEHRGHR